MTKQEPEYVFSKLFHKETVPMTDTLKVAEVFGKRHKNIIQAVKELDCSNEFRRLNFQPSYYLNEQNKRQPKFNMTQDGFTFLVMGFRGKKAAEFKEAYIKQFLLLAQLVQLAGYQTLTAEQKTVLANFKAVKNYLTGNFRTTAKHVKAVEDGIVTKCYRERFVKDEVKQNDK